MARRKFDPEKDNPIAEARRYLDNARRLLTEKAGKEDRFYSDKKYVRMAGNTACNGVLIALNAALNIEAHLKKDSRPSIDTYKMAARKEGYDLVMLINEGYTHLHLFMGYDGTLQVSTVKTAMELAQEIVDWCEKRSQRSTAMA
jgi:Domain of unknown function (DUF5618)